MHDKHMNLWKGRNGSEAGYPEYYCRGSALPHIPVWLIQVLKLKADLSRLFLSHKQESWQMTQPAKSPVKN